MNNDEPTQEELIRITEVDDRVPVVYDWIRSTQVNQEPHWITPYVIRPHWDRPTQPQRLLYVGTGAEDSELEQMVLMGANLIFFAPLPLSAFDQRFHPMHFNIPVMSPNDEIQFRVRTNKTAAKGLLILMGTWWDPTSVRP